MSVTHKMYGPFFENLMKGNIPDMEHGDTTIKVALMYEDGATPFSFDQDHDNWDDVKAYECDDGDYTADGEEITGAEVNYDDRVTTFDSSTDPKEVEFTAEGDIKATYAVIYLFGDDGELADADKKLISCIDFGGERESVQGAFKITFHENGIFKVTVSD